MNMWLSYLASGCVAQRASNEENDVLGFDHHYLVERPTVQQNTAKQVAPFTNMD